VFAGLENPIHLLVILVVALLVFGPKRLPDMGRSLGHGMRQFRESLSGKSDEDQDAAVLEAPTRTPESPET
jgi:sec-independent protein translocase protein TatA